MPFRSRETLQSWLSEFESLGYSDAGRMRVVEQDDMADDNSGLVIVELADGATSLSIQPEASDGETWVATMEPREATVTMDAASMLNLAGELSVVSALCAFLQAKSRAFVGQESR